ncbi:MAG: CsbD family protein [Burkholderiaceae bacterium]|nr:CsbD family protein [Burkholderiaceae bacterium]
MNKDQITGRVDEIKGISKEKAGKLLDDKDLKTQGTKEKLSGKIQSNLGDAKEKTKELIDKI